MISIRDLTKRFGDITALDEVTLEIGTGETFGLLGPNGAGKTTLINILCAYLSQDSGEISINGLGLPGSESKIKQLLGIVPQEVSLYEDLSAYENLIFWGKLYGLSRNPLKDRAEQLLKAMGLWDRRKDAVKRYSGGMKRRINIAAGIIHDPPIIFFDEPTVGVDPQSRNFIFEIIEEMHRQGKTIIYTSHYMEEVERLCTRVGIIDHGNLIALGTRQELYKELGEDDHIKIRLRNPISAGDLENSLGISVSTTGETNLLLHGKNLIGKLSLILNTLEQMNAELDEVNIVQPNLEQVFLTLTGRELRE